MRLWWKYILEETEEPVHRQAREDGYRTAEEHAAAMGGYEPDESYADRESFFAKYYNGFQWSRIEDYEPFVRRVLPVGAKTLSIASGRAALECRLIADGYRVTCSDLEVPACAEATRRLFPGLEYVAYDALRGSTETAYDAVLALGLVFLLDEERLKTFLANMRASIRPGGQLILDVSSCSDSLLSRFYHNTLLKWDAHACRLWLARKGRHILVHTRKHGWLHSDRDILEAAGRHGFACREHEEGGGDLTMRRSYFLGRYVGTDTFMGAALNAFGRKMPFLRLFNLVRVD